MKCPECAKEGKRSRITVAPGGFCTLMATHQWYDEDGNFHFNDPNKTTRNYSCSNGHKWSERK